MHRTVSGGAMGLALGQPGASGLLIFGAIGLGLAAPYLILSFVPGLARLLPRPGSWMETLKQLFSFAMFATAVWLVWVISTQSGPSGVLRIGLGLVAIAFAAWLFGRSQRGQSGWLGRIVALAALVGGIAYATSKPRDSALDEVVYDPTVLSQLRENGTPVFVDFTASWCVTCQFNKINVLTKPAVARAFEDAGVVFMVADWTRQDPVITAALEEQGRAGVPLYLYYPPGADAPTVLPQILSMRDVLSLVGD